jgi:pilus assembly protein TadC
VFAVLAGLLVPALLGLVGGIAGFSLGLPVGWLISRVLRRRASAPRAPQRRSVSFVLELLASALSAGAPPEAAIAAVVAAVAGFGSPQLQTAVSPLRRVGRLLQLGTDPALAWSSVAEVDGFRSVAAAGRRCSDSGARLAGALREVASELRAQHREDAVAGAERTGVWALLPLACCFLPAFVCLGIVPVVAGVAGQVLPKG